MFGKKKKMRDKHTLTPRGIFAARYIIKKYLNEEDIDTIASYEQMIDECQEKLEQAKYYDYLSSTMVEENKLPLENPEIRKLFAAIMVAAIILRSLIPEERKKYLDLITDEKRRKSFEESLESKMFKF